MKNYNNGIQTDVAILDFSKVFDTVPHDKLRHLTGYPKSRKNPKASC